MPANLNYHPIWMLLIPGGTSEGITVEPTTGLITTEQGAQDTFTIVLTSPPTSTVTINLVSSDTTEGNVSPASVLFDTDSWNIAQTVTVTGLDDDVDDEIVAYTIYTEPAVSADPNYSGANAEDVAVTNQDDDNAGVSVDPISLTTTEAGGSGSFSVALNSEPTESITITLLSEDTSEGSISPTSLDFTPANWNVLQTATVTGLDDDVADGDVTYKIATSVISDDSTYKAIDPEDVSVTNQDDDSAGISVAPISLTTTEAGGSGSFSVVLDSEPTESITITLLSEDTSEGSVSPASLTFTSVNWNVLQTATVTGVDDDVADGDVTYKIATSVSSDDDTYAAIDPADVSVTNQDDDSAGISVTPTSLTTTEAGDSDSFSVILISEPTSSITVSLMIEDMSEGSISPTSLIFTPANWDQSQDATVTGEDDDVADGDVTYKIVTSVSSDDNTYAAINPDDVSVTNQDDDSSGISVTPTSLTTTEAGGSDTFEVVLTSEPVAIVSINLSSSDPSEGIVVPTLLEFSEDDWYSPKVVTVTGVDDAMEDGDITFSILTAPAVSTDMLYSGMNAGDVIVTNSDDDVSGILVTPIIGLTTSESGLTDAFNVTLSSKPLASVSIEMNTTDLSEGGVTPTSLTFTIENWNTPQQVNLIGMDDEEDDGDIAYMIITSPASSGDPKYNGMNPADISAINLDNEDRPVTIDDEYNLLEDNVLHILVPGILENDSAEGEVMHAVLVDNVSNGSLSLKIDGSFTYTPTANYFGEDTFTYRVNDGIADSDTAKVTLTVGAVNDAPVPYPDEYLSNGNRIEIQSPGVLTNDFDVDGDPLVSILDETTINGELEFESNGSFTYTPPYTDFNGVDVFRYHITDGSLVSGKTESRILIDTIPPTVTWLSPVSNGEIYYAAETKIHLEIDANDDQIIPVLPVNHVNFSRWDANNKVYVDLGSVYMPPYEKEVDLLELNYGWNQVFACAYDAAGNQSERGFIWLYLNLAPRVYLPMTSR